MTEAEPDRKMDGDFVLTGSSDLEGLPRIESGEEDPGLRKRTAEEDSASDGRRSRQRSVTPQS